MRSIGLRGSLRPALPRLSTLLLLLLAGDATAADTKDYKVQAGDTCESIAKKVLGDATRCAELRALNPELSDPKAKPKAGSTLKVPKPPPDARVVSVSGQVDAGNHPAQKDEGLPAASSVVTLASGRAQLSFKEPWTVQLGPQTTFWVLGTPPPVVGKGAGLGVGQPGNSTLVRGALEVTTGATAKKPFVLGTASAKVTVAPGSLALVSIDETATLRVAVHAGKASVESGGKRTDLDQGLGLVVKKGAPVAKPGKLPEVGKWMAPPPLLVLAQGDDGPLSSMVSGVASQWHLEIASDPAFTDVLFDLRPKADGPNMALEQTLPVGHFFSRISAIDKDGLEGPPSAVSSTVVAHARVTPAALGKRATLELSAGIFCGLDGASLSPTTGAPLELAAGHAHVLSCATSGDGVGARKLEIPLKDAGTLTLSADLGPATFDKARAGTRVVTLKVTDPAGEPVEGAEVIVTATDGATFDLPKPGPTPGTYLLSVRWAPTIAVKKTRLHVALATTSTLDFDVPLDAAPPPPSGAGAPVPERPFRSELGLGGNLLGATADLGVGLGAGIEGGYRYSLGNGAIAMALRLGFERYALAKTKEEHCQGTAAGTPCGSDGVRTWSSVLDSTVFAVGLPLTYRFGAQDATFTPYVGLLPQLLVEKPRVQATGAVTTSGMLLSPPPTTDSGTRFAVSGLLGIAARRADGPGSFFLELGYRLAGSHDLVTRDAGLSGLLSMLGYRLAL